MPKLPVISAKKLLKALKLFGFEQVSQRGSHIKLTRMYKGQRQVIIVPNHKVIKSGTLRNGILKPAKISVEDLISVL